MRRRYRGAWSFTSTLVREQFAPFPPKRYFVDDRTQVVKEILAGFSVALTMVGEGIAFAFILNVEPNLALHATWIVGLITSLLGSRLGMINGADGVRAAALGPFILANGVEYLFPIVILMSILFFIASLLNLMQAVRMIPNTVMTGFVNGLAIIIFIGQIEHFRNKTDHVYYSGPTLYWMLFEVALTVIISLALPRIPKIGPILPSALFGMGICTIFDRFVLVGSTDWSTPTIGTVSNLTGEAPMPFWLNPQYKTLNFDWDMFIKILVPSITTAGACFVETVMTMEVVDDLTQTENNRPRQQIYSMSLANLIAGIFGTMGGAALIPETVFNIVVAGANGRYRISAFVAALVVLIFVFVAQEFIKVIPLAAIVGVMLIVVFHTFDWSSLPIVVASFLPWQLRKYIPFLKTRKVDRFDAGVIIITTIIVVVTNLFIAVLVGVLLTSAAVAWQAGESLVIREAKQQQFRQPLEQDDTQSAIKVYVVEGALLFSASKRFIRSFHPQTDPDRVEVEFKTLGVQLRDFASIHALNVVGKKYHELGKTFAVRGLDPLSLKRLEKADTLIRYFEIVPLASDPTETEPVGGGSHEVTQVQHERDPHGSGEADAESGSVVADDQERGIVLS